MRLIWSIGDEGPEGEEREHDGKERDGKGEREGIIYQRTEGLENWENGRAVECEEKREGRRERERERGRSSRGRGPLLRGFRRPKSRVPKSTIPSRAPLDIACRPIFTIPRLPTISPFGFSLINSSNSHAGCLEFVEGVWESEATNQFANRTIVNE